MKKGDILTFPQDPLRLEGAICITGKVMWLEEIKEGPGIEARVAKIPHSLHSWASGGKFYYFFIGRAGDIFGYGPMKGEEEAELKEKFPSGVEELRLQWEINRPCNCGHTEGVFAPHPHTPYCG